MLGLCLGSGWVWADVQDRKLSRRVYSHCFHTDNAKIWFAPGFGSSVADPNTLFLFCFVRPIYYPRTTLDGG